MMESAKTARLWAGFHHLSERDKDVVLCFAELTRKLPENTVRQPALREGERRKQKTM
ncbi:MAG: hypothetical protein LBS97_04575 [Treponema sp.]|jgi:hypothetical protein|nr:hypothetical protein [Treponema sp.]